MTTDQPRRRSPILSQAYSHWRLAAKARKAGQYNLAAHHQRIADRFHRQWLDSRAAIDRPKERQAEDARRAEAALVLRLAASREQILADEARAAVLLDRREAS